jgi:hypothetical protein
MPVIFGYHSCMSFLCIFMCFIFVTKKRWNSAITHMFLSFEACGWNNMVWCCWHDMNMTRVLQMPMTKCHSRFEQVTRFWMVNIDSLIVFSEFIHDRSIEK